MLPTAAKTKARLRWLGICGILSVGLVCFTHYDSIAANSDDGSDVDRYRNFVPHADKVNGSLSETLNDDHGLGKKNDEGSINAKSMDDFLPLPTKESPTQYTVRLGEPKTNFLYHALHKTGSMATRAHLRNFCATYKLQCLTYQFCNRDSNFVTCSKQMRDRFETDFGSMTYKRLTGGCCPPFENQQVLKFDGILDHFPRNSEENREFLETLLKPETFRFTILRSLDFVGLYENLDESWAALRYKLKWTPGYFEPSPKHQKLRRRKLPQEVIQKIERIQFADVKLYTLAKSLYYDSVRTWFPSDQITPAAE